MVANGPIVLEEVKKPETTDDQVTAFSDAIEFQMNLGPGFMQPTGGLSHFAQQLAQDHPSSSWGPYP